MLDLKKIAITGGVASGKTSVCQLFKELGAFVVSADAMVHELLTPETDLGQQIIRSFGSDLVKNGKLDRRLLAERVFHDPERLRQLEQLIHPVVLRRIEELYLAVKGQKYTSFVVEIPLLFEIGAASFYDITVAVLSDEESSRRRFEQAGYKSTEYDLRRLRQLSPEEKAKRADYIIQNKGSLSDLRKEVLSLNRIIHLTGA